MSTGRAILVRRNGQRERRELGDLISIGPAMLRDFEMLGVNSVAELAKQNPQRMYERLGRIVGQRQDPCVLDVFCAAVAQAKNPWLEAEKCQWWWWSRERKKMPSSSKIFAHRGIRTHLDLERVASGR